MRSVAEPGADPSAPEPAPRAPRRRRSPAVPGDRGLWPRLKRLILHASKLTGLQALVRESRWRQARLLVLCYHGISTDDEHEWNAELYMPAPMFRRRLEILRDGGYSVLPLDDAVERLYQGTLPPRSVVITFDDGAANFYSRALPLLREFDFPATVYLTTYHTSARRPVFDVTLPYILWKGRHRSLSRDLVGGDGEWRLSDAAEREQAREALRAHLVARGRGGHAEEALLAEVARRLGVDFDAIRERRIMHLMTEEEVSVAAELGVSIQLHTHRHRTPRDEAEFAHEIEVNRGHIVRLTRRTDGRWHFCYPNGWRAREFIPWLRGLDVRSAATCQPGIASRTTDPILLPRLVDTTLLSEIEFEGWLSGVSAFLPRRVQPYGHDDD